MKNYIELDDFSLLYDHFAYVDTEDYYADRLLKWNRVRIRFGKEYHHPSRPFVITVCRVRKADRHAFLAAMRKMEDNLLLCGYEGYADVCREVIPQQEGEDEYEVCSAGKTEQARAEGASQPAAGFVERRGSGDEGSAQQKDLRQKATREVNLQRSGNGSIIHPIHTREWNVCRDLGIS